MLLSELFSRAGVLPDRLSGDAEVSGMIMDSRKARPGSLFVAMPSKNSDSHSFIGAAKAGGAAAVLAHSVAGFDLAVCSGLPAALVLESLLEAIEGLSGSFLPDAEYRFNEAVWRLAKVAFGNPSASMKIIGVTGTNGKTTTAWLIRDMLTALGVRAGYLGTLGFQIPGEERELQNTTPFSIELNELLAEARDKGVEAMAIEVSSHALAERRADGIEFDAAVFTNLTQDHLDFHGSMEAYEAAKMRLFTELPAQSTKKFCTVVNVDDPAGLRLYRRLRPESASYTVMEFICDGNFDWLAPGLLPFTFGVSTPDSFRAQHSSVEVDSLSFEVAERNETAVGHDAEKGDRGKIFKFWSRLGGHYNLENVLGACATVCVVGPDCREVLDDTGSPRPIYGPALGEVREALRSARPVPGRFEAVQNDAGIGILVDYAHTPDAVEKLLDAVRPLTKGRIITVFGCGGDRDKGKRPKMAKAASERSDVTVITSDNPRTEDPLAIVKDVASGIRGKVDWSRVQGQGAPATYRQAADATVILDRGEAIAYAIQIAQPGDVVVIAGKGHENYQIIGRTKHPMDDRDLAREGLAKREV